MRLSKRIDVVLISIAMATAIIFLLSCQKEGGGRYAGPVEKIALGVVAIESSSLVYIADALDMFRGNGLDATVMYVPDGVKASDDLLQDKIDVAVAADFIFVTRSLGHDDLRILGSVFRGDTFEVIARKDRGITKPADLKGKRIGLTSGTILDFFMGTFLSMQGIEAGSVTLVNCKPSEIAEAVSSGSVDAVIAWEPYAARIKNNLGANAIIWPGQSGQSYQFVLMAKGEFIKERPIAVERLLKALLEAEQFCSEHAADARKLIAARVGQDPAMLESLWKKVDLRLRLDQDLITVMEDEARWLLKQGKGREVPNYLKYVDWRPLAKIKADAIGLIH